MKLKKKYQNQHNINLLDSIYDQHKLDVLRSNCSIYIHGHSAGGTNPSLVEAMNLGLPVVAFDVVYNKETTFNMALYFKDTQALLKILSELDKTNLSKISLDMKSLAEKHYTWLSVSEKYAKIF